MGVEAVQRGSSNSRRGFSEGAIVAQVFRCQQRNLSVWSCCTRACGFIPPGCCCTCSTCCIFANSFKFSLPPSGLSRFRATCMQSARYSCSTRGIQLGFYVIFSLFWLFISCSTLPLFLVTGDFGKLPKTFFIFDLMKSWRAVVAFAHVRKCFH